jgi:hypothetical protein
MTISTPEGLAQMLADAQAYKRLVRTARRELNPVLTGTGDLIRSAYEYAGDRDNIGSARERATKGAIAKIEEYLGTIEGLIDILRSQAMIAAEAVEAADAKRARAARALRI